MNAIEALMQRMDQAPEEFVDDLTWRGTRWEEVTDIMIAESKMKPRVFTQEEIDAYLDKLSAITRKNVEEHVCVELLNPLRTTADQLDMFPASEEEDKRRYPPSSLLTSAKMQNEALRVLQDEIDKNMQDHMDQHIALQEKLLYENNYS